MKDFNGALDAHYENEYERHHQIARPNRRSFVRRSLRNGSTRFYDDDFEGGDFDDE